MEQYISKSALVAEIERQKAQWRICKSSEAKYRREMLDDISSFIDTLEVKGVDLNEEIANQYEANYEEYLTYEEFADIAKHFFELGLKAQKEKEDVNSPKEECNTIYKDIVLIDRDGNRIKAKIEQREKV